jgi:membrane protease subunit HflK
MTMEEKMDKKMQQKNGFVADLLGTCIKYFKWVGLAIVLVILASGIRTVKQGEVAVVLRFGKLSGETREEQIHEPGLLFAFPYIIDEVITVPVGKVFDLNVDTHYTEGKMSREPGEDGYCITGDQNIVLLATSLKYTVSDPVSYALYTANMEDTVRGVVSASLTSNAAAVGIDSLLTDGKDKFARDVLRDAQTSLDALDCGVKLTALDLTNVAPPTEVKVQFDAVTSANVSAKTKLAEAEQYKATLLPNAEKEKNALISQATVNQKKAVSEAELFLAEFYGLLAEYEKNPDIVTLRVYNEKLAEIYQKLGDKLIITLPEEGTGGAGGTP